MSISLVRDFSIVAICPSMQLPALLFVCVLFVLFLLFVVAFWWTKAETRARVGRPQTSSSPPVILLLVVPRRLFCFGSFVVLDVVFRYLSLFLLYINIKIGKN